MLDFNNIDVENIARNWFTDFNDLISKNQSLEDALNIFHEESHWRDLVSLTGDIITFSEIKKFYNDLKKFSHISQAKDFKIDQNRTPPR